MASTTSSGMRDAGKPRRLSAREAILTAAMVVLSTILAAAARADTTAPGSGSTDATAATPAQLQPAARVIVVRFCSQADATKDLATFETALNKDANYAMPVGGKTPTPLQTAVDKEAKELFLLAHNGVEPADYLAALIATENPLAAVGPGTGAAAGAPATPAAPAKKAASPYLNKAAEEVSLANQDMGKVAPKASIVVPNMKAAAHDLAQVPNPPSAVDQALVEVTSANEALAKSPPDLDAADPHVVSASKFLAGVAEAAPGVDHFFVWLGYQVANPFAFTAAQPSTATTSTTTMTGGTSTTATTTTTTPPAPGTNGTIKPNTTYGVALELDYLNRLAWDPSRNARFVEAQPLNPFDPRNWDIETRLFFSLSTPPSTATTSSTGAQTSSPTVSATALEGAGNFGGEVAVTQNLYVARADPANFQTIGIEERFSGVSDRSSYRNHPEEFVGLDYSIGSFVTPNATEPLRVNFRVGADWLDTVSFTNPTSTSSQQVYTANGAPVFYQKGFGSIQSEALVPLGNNSFLAVGGRVYLGTTRPAPWTSYVGYSIDIGSIAQALGLGGSKSGTSTQAAQPSNAGQ